MVYYICRASGLVSDARWRMLVNNAIIMGREGQPREYSREALDAAQADVDASSAMVGKVRERSGHHALSREHRVAGSHAEQFGNDVRNVLQQIGELLGVSDLSVAWKGLEGAKRRLQEMEAAGETEARALNEEYERRKHAAKTALQELVDFEREKLEKGDSAETSEEAQ